MFLEKYYINIQNNIYLFLGGSTLQIISYHISLENFAKPKEIKRERNYLLIWDKQSQQHNATTIGEHDVAELGTQL